MVDLEEEEDSLVKVKEERRPEGLGGEGGNAAFKRGPDGEGVGGRRSKAARGPSDAAKEQQTGETSSWSELFTIILFVCCCFICCWFSVWLDVQILTDYSWEIQLLSRANLFC